jgi:hypothetical protein
MHAARLLIAANLCTAGRCQPAAARAVGCPSTHLLDTTGSAHVLWDPEVQLGETFTSLALRCDTTVALECEVKKSSVTEPRCPRVKMLRWAGEMYASACTNETPHVRLLHVLQHAQDPFASFTDEQLWSALRSVQLASLPEVRIILNHDHVRAMQIGTYTFPYLPTTKLQLMTAGSKVLALDFDLCSLHTFACALSRAVLDTTLQLPPSCCDGATC